VKNVFSITLKASILQGPNPICVHLKLLRKEIYSTDEKHYPEEKLALTQYSVQVAKRDPCALVRDKFNQRKNAAAKRLLTKAKFRSAADLEDWNQTFDRGFTKTKIRELAATGFYQAHENLLLLGKTGAGKTHLAIAIGRRLCTENISTLFFPVKFLFEEVMAAKSSGKYLAFVKKLSQSQVIILDNFGLKIYTDDEANVLVDILEDRHRKGSVVVTSQVDTNGWLKLFEDPLIAEAIASRLEHPSQKLIINGGN